MQESNGGAVMRALLRSYTPAPQLQEALNAAGTPDALRAGQLWRASAQNTRALVLLLADPTDAQETSQVPVVLATVAEQPADGSAVPSVTAPTRTLSALTVWPSLQAHLGTHVLLTLVEDSAETAGLARAAEASGGRPGPDCDADPFDPSARLLAELADDLSALASAANRPRLNGPDARVTSERPNPRLPLASRSRRLAPPNLREPSAPTATSRGS